MRLYSGCYSFNDIFDTILLTTCFQIVYCIFGTKTISNEKVVNCKVIDLVDYYNFNGFLSPFNNFNHVKSDPRTNIVYLDL